MTGRRLQEGASAFLLRPVFLGSDNEPTTGLPLETQMVSVFTTEAVNQMQAGRSN